MKVRCAVKGELDRTEETGGMEPWVFRTSTGVAGSGRNQQGTLYVNKLKT